MSKLSRVEQQSALNFACLVADKAQHILRDYPNGVAFTSKNDGTPVSEVDRRIEKMAAGAVSRRNRGEQLLGEEDAASHRPTASKVWVVDPIDGTEQFVAGMPGYVFSMALVVDGEPEVAIVRDPRTGWSWSAMAGRGAHLDWMRPLGVSRRAGLDHAVMRVSRSCDSADYLWPEVVSTVQNGGVTTMRFGSVIRACMDVAMGEIDAVIFGRTSPWDMATAALIVPEAGGRFTDLLGQPQRLDRPVNGAIVSNGLVHDQILDIVQAQLVRS